MITASEKIDRLANDVRLAVFARLSMLLMPLVASAGTWLLYNVYTSIELAQTTQAKEINQLELKVQQHDLILENGKQSRLEFQSRSDAHFDVLDDKIEKMLDGISQVRETVVRVQTIVETRLPQKATELGEKKWPLQ